MPNQEVRQTRETAAPADYEHRKLIRDHPLEESQKSYHTTLEQQIAQAEEELKRPWLALLLSGLTAGLDIGFGPFAMAVVLTLTRDAFPDAVTQLLMANAYTIGFVLVVIGRSALFTEHTTAAVTPLLARRSSVRALLRLWSLVLFGNIAGAAVFSMAAVQLGPALGVADAAAFGEIARGMIDKPAGITLLSAIGAGWIMGMLVWLTVSVRDSISQLLIIWLTTLLIALGRFHHSVAGTVEVLLGYFAGTGVTTVDFLRFLVLAVVGNAIGGVVFVALLKFGHVHQSVRR